MRSFHAELLAAKKTKSDIGARRIAEHLLLRGFNKNEVLNFFEHRGFSDEETLRITSGLFEPRKLENGMDDKTEQAMKLYHAYNAGGSDPAFVNKNFRGEPCPLFENLPPNVQEKWVAVYEFVRSELNREFDDIDRG